MAKKKVTDETTEEAVVVDKTADISKHFDKMFGGGVFVNARQFLTKPKQVIPFAPKIDIALNGGIPEGSTVLCSGQPKTGKTTTALSFAARCQQEQYGGRDVYYFDIEGRLKNMNLNGIKGLNPDKFFVIQSTDEKIMSAEEFLEGAVHVILNKRKALIILDSSSALCASKEQIGEIKSSTRNDGPKLLANFFRKIGTAVNVTNNILWIMQHLIANTSGFGEAYREDGGQKAQYQADVKLRVKWAEPWKIGKEDDAKQIGQEMHWQIVTSALGGLPNQSAETFIRYNIGIDDIKEYQDLATSLAIINVNGSWYTFRDCKKQGEEKLYQAFTESPELFALLKQDVNEIMNA